MNSISIVTHSINKADVFEEYGEALDFAHSLPAGSNWAVISSERVTDHTGRVDKELEEMKASANRSNALELALRTGMQGVGLIQSAEQIREYLESGTVAGKKSGTTPIPL